MINNHEVLVFKAKLWGSAGEAAGGNRGSRGVTPLFGNFCNFFNAV